MASTDTAKANLNPHKAAVAAMYLYGGEYSRQGRRLDGLLEISFT
jgi:hypothetical protein